MRRRVGREDLKDVFEPAQSMIRTWGFRRTLQGVMPEDWGLVVSACEQRVRGLVENRLKGMGYDQGYICKAEARLLRVLQENGRVTTREVSDAVAHCFETDEGKEMANVEGEDGKIADAKFCLQYSLPVLLTVSHGLRRIDNHGQGTKLVKGPTCVRMGEEEAVRLCAERYFDVYGPAEELDFRYWTGLYAGICKNIVTELENEGVLLVVKRSGGGRPLYIHRDRMSQLSCVDNLKVDGRRRVWFLGRFDAMILAHKDKTWIVREENRKSVWGLSAEVAATVLVDGRMVGKWRRDDTRMEIILFTRYVFNESVLEEIAERATEILQWFWKQDRATVTIFDADRNELWSNT